MRKKYRSAIYTFSEDQKIEAEKKDLIDNLNSQLLDQVIANTKTKLNTLYIYES